VQQWASDEHVSPYDAILRIQEHPTLGKAAKQALAAFGALMKDFQEAMEELQLPELIDRIAERSGLGPELREEADGEERWSNVLELRRVADDYAEIETHTALELFLENVALVGGADTTQTGEDGTLITEENRDAVTFITLHAAKGLEFPVVFIVGMDEGSLPHARSVDKPEQLEEERRLAYVGFTRAMRRLYLLRARRRSFFGDVVPTEPSRFLEDIPTRLMTRSGAAGSFTPARASTGRRSVWDDDFNQDTYASREPAGRVFGSGRPPARPALTPVPKASSPLIPPTKPSPVPPPLPETSPPPRPRSQQFKPGDKVRHATFGEGMVLKSEMEQQTEFVEVQFHGKHGKKLLSMDFAKLDKIS
jgi:DNA helicase-2/ATP-dependent DNA helicase PcrA